MSANHLSTLRSLICDPQELPLTSSPRHDAARMDSLLQQARQSLDSSLPNDKLTLLEGMVLAWHEFWDEAHNRAQEVHSKDGSFLHGILHRREPDASNAGYWFHRVGHHPVLATLAVKAKPLLEDAPPPLARILRDGLWDPFAFIEQCEQVRRHPDPVKEALLRKLQRLEFDTLLEHIHEDGRWKMENGK